MAQTSAGELSVSSRFIAWGSAVSSFKERPIIGWGENNAYYGLNKNFNPALVQFDPDLSDGARTWYDKSHNVYLDLLCEKGLVGAALFLIIMLLTARSMLRVKDRQLAIALAGGLMGHLVAIFFAFNTFASLFALFLFFPILLLSERSTKPLEKLSSESLSRDGAKAPPWLQTVKRAAIPALVLLLAASVYINLQVGRASLGYGEARSVFAADPESGFRAYRSAFESYSPYCDKEKLNCAALTIQNVINKKLTYDPDATIRLAYQLAQDAARGLPNDAAIFMALTDMCNNLGIYKDPAYLKDAERFGQKALELSPGRQEIAFYLGRTYLLTGNPARAVQLNRRAVANYPAFPLAHWFLGLSLIADGKPQEARQEIRKAVDLGYRFRTPAEADVVKALFGDEYDELARIM
jgi:tetratricopeptide (TPR) repeat protein